MRVLLVAALIVACGAPAVLASPTPPSPLSVAALKFRVFDLVGRPWYCDSDFYPVARADERDVARQRLPEIQQDAETYDAILRRSSLPPASATWSDAQLLAVYRDWKDLRALALTPTGLAGVYGFTMLVRPPDAAKRGSERIEGRIDGRGQVNVLSRQAAGPPNCPICLADTTLIATPHGPVRVAELAAGDAVWTIDAAGRRVAAPVLEVASVEAPPGHEVIRVTLSDGRTVTASPGHPAADGREIGSLVVGDALDGSTIAVTERLPYRGRTFDVLPAGASGAYWADGVLLASTLDQRRRAQSR